MPVSVMLKPASSNCNLACEYCFYHSLSSQREQFSKGFMTAQTAHRVIDSAFEFAASTEVFFTFQGGEPLLCPIEFYRDFVAYAENNNKYHSKINYCLQTNGTLITDEYAEFFAENGFLLGVSLDGDESLNKYRVYKNSEPSFDDVMNGIDLLKKHGVSFNILSVLTKNTARNFRQAYRFFKSNNLRFLQFITGLKPFDGNFDKELYMDNDDYQYFLTKAFTIYYNDLMRNDYVSIRSFDNYASLASGGNAEQCGMNGFCSTQFVVEGDGSVYPCDFYCTDEWLLGNIGDMSLKQMYKLEKSVEFLKSSFCLDEKCKSCKYFSLCRGGGCKRNRESCDYCKAYEAFFSQCEDKIKQIKK